MWLQKLWRDNYEEKLSGEIISRNYYTKLSGEIMTRNYDLEYYVAQNVETIGILAYPKSDEYLIILLMIINQGAEDQCLKGNW